MEGVETTFQLYVPAIRLEGGAKRKIALMLTVGGHSALDMHNTLDFIEDWED